MGQWHSIKELLEIIKQIKVDTPLFQIYEDEIIVTKTFASFNDWYTNLKTRVKKYFKVDLRSFIPRWTKNNKVYRENWESIKIKNMIEINLKLENIFNNLESNTTSLDIAQKLIIELLSLSTNTKFDRNKIKVLFIYYWKKYDKKLNLRRTFKLLEISKSTYYENVKKIIDGVIYERKIRTDSKVDNIEYQTKALQIAKETKKRISIDKCSYLYNLSKYKPNLTISAKPLAKIFRKLNILTNSGSSFINSKRYKEKKNTNFIAGNLLTKEFINSSNYKKIFSTDFTIIKHNKYGHLHILSSINVKNFYVPYIKISYKQSKENVKDMIKKIGNIDILHSDNGAEFKSKDVINYCLLKNIRQSFSSPGCSVENRWIEYFWGRLKMECLNHIKNISDLSIERIQDYLDDYVNYWNNKRPIKKFAYSTPSSLAK